MAKNNIREAFPLAWPLGWIREKEPVTSRFATTIAQTVSGLTREVSLLGGTDLIISTNVPLKSNGLPYSNHKPTDAAVAVYFTLKGKPMVFACDKFTEVHDNLHSIELTINSIRGIERWGCSDMLERAFTGFLCLPAGKTTPKWHKLLGLSESASKEEIKTAYRAALKRLHPDNKYSGNQQQFIELQQACSEILLT